MNFKSRGEIATTLTLITLGLMVAGAIAGSRLSQTGPRLESQAITPPSNSCAGNSCLIPGSFCTTCLNPKEQQSCPAGYGVTKVYTCKNFKWQEPPDYLECQAPCAPPAATPQPTSPPSQPTPPPAICGDACTQCILNNRSDILPFYRNNGWDISCNNHNAIVSDWCSVDDLGCRQIQNTTCSSACTGVVRCTGFNFFDGPTNGATLIAGKTYRLEGWARACTSPSGQGFRHALDLHLCQGSSCNYIGAASASDRPDTVSYCGTTQPNQNGWYFDWVIPSDLAGTYTIKAANIATDQKDASGNFKCINWSEKTVSILPATPTPTPICLIPEGCNSPTPPILTPTPTPRLCLQVFTPARNKLTGVCKLFPTSCLPDGWVADRSCVPSPTPPIFTPTPTPICLIPEGCNSPTPPIFTTRPNPPTGLRANCNQTGTRASFLWDRTQDSIEWAVRVNDTENGWEGYIPLPGDSVDDHISAAPNSNTVIYERDTIPGHTYTWWVHGINSSGWSEGTQGPDLICPTDPSVSLPSTATDKIGTLIPPIDPSICEGEGGKCIARAQCVASDPNAIVEAFRGCPIEQICCKSSSKAGGGEIVTGSTNPDFAQAIDCFSKELCNPLQISLFINQLNRWTGLQIQPCEVPCEFKE